VLAQPQAVGLVREEQADLKAVPLPKEMVVQVTHGLQEMA
jgi:hypothetical protein